MRIGHHQASRLTLRPGRALCAALLLAWLPGCRSVQPLPVTPARVWPSPPAEARIAYETSLAGPEDFGMRKPAWKRILRFLAGVDKGLNTFSKPLGIALDDQGNLCVADPGSASVWFFDTAAARFHRWDKAGAVSFVAPVAVAKTGETVFVADPGLGKIVAFSTRGKLLFEITGGIERPAGLALHEDTLFVVDALADQVLVYDLQGRLLRRFGTPGTGPGQLNAPTHITLDGEGRIYVTDTLNFRVQVFDPGGQYKGSIGSMGDSSGHFSRPKGVAVDPHGHVYVVDALFDNVQAFDREGRFLIHWGATGSKPGEFWLPAGIAVDSAGRIYVADSYNRRIQVFKYVGTS
jgi:DNA-binding beta-propeller fold protein YncE